MFRSFLPFSSFRNNAAVPLSLTSITPRRARLGPSKTNSPLPPSERRVDGAAQMRRSLRAPALVLFDQNGKDRAELQVTPSGKPGWAMADENGKSMIAGFPMEQPAQ